MHLHTFGSALNFDLNTFKRIGKFFSKDTQRVYYVFILERSSIIVYRKELCKSASEASSRTRSKTYVRLRGFEPFLWSSSF